MNSGVLKCFLFVLTLTSVHAFYVTSFTMYPPFLRRVDKSKLLWDTGDVARWYAMTDGVVVSYQGVWLLSDALHPIKPVKRHDNFGPLECYGARDALCAGAFGRVFPTTTPILITPRYDSLHPELRPIAEGGCLNAGSGINRFITNKTQYDVTACDIDPMKYIVFHYQNKLYVIDMPYPPYLHFLLCISIVVSLSGVLYMLKPGPLSKDRTTENGVQSQLLDGVLLNVFVASLSSTVFHGIHSSFVTYEDLLGYYFIGASLFFYFVFVIYWRVYYGLHQPGMFMDLSILHISFMFVTAFASLNHPFQTITLCAIIFRVWNKIIRFTHGVAGTIHVPFAIPRIIMDCVNLSIGLAYGWNVSITSGFLSTCWLTPMIWLMYLFAKYVFLENIALIA